MDDPFFEATISAVRGFDLGDDDALSSTLGEHETGLDADEWLLRAVLEVRAQRLEQALSHLERATQCEATSTMSLIHYLRSRLLSRRGRTAAAGEALDAAERAAQADGRIPDAELAHARALLEWEAGRPDDALRLIKHGLQIDDSSAARWRDQGSLLIELERPEEALVALERALTLDTDDDTAMVLHAIADAALDNADSAARWIERTLHLCPERREALAGEPRIAAVRHHPSVARLLEPRPPAEPGWMDELAPWISALRYALQRGDRRDRHAIEWLDQTESRRLHARMLHDHQRGPLGTMHSAATLQYARELLGQRVLVGRGPASKTREGTEERCLLAIDPGPYGELWVALSDVYPPFLWIPARRDAASLHAVLDEYFPQPPRLRRVAMPSQVRGFVGYRERIVVPSPISGRLEPAGELELDRYLEINPFVESAGWGSAFTDDPWPDEIPAQPGIVLKIDANRGRVAEQALGAVWSMTRRLRHSRGYISIERHHGEIFVAVVRYRPSPFPAPVATLNKRFGSEYPVDLPVDAVAALLGFQFDSATDLEAQLAATNDPQEAAGLLVVISALRHSDLDVQPLYRKWAQHDDPLVRSTICTIAVEYNYESLLETMSVSEPDEALREQIGEVLDEGIPTPREQLDEGQEVRR